MKYYKLINSLNTKEIGVYAQAESINKLGDKEEVYLVGRKNPINFQWDIPEPIMQKKAKPTTYLDVIPFSNIIFLVLKRYFINFLKDFNIGDFNFWPLKVHHKDEIISDYSLFHLSYPSDSKYVDYKNSEFLVGKLGDWKDPDIRKPVKVKDYENYMNLLDVLSQTEDNSQIRCNKLIFDFRNAKEDLIRFIDVPFGLGYYVSERLKKVIEEQRFTGMVFQEIEEYNKHIKVIY